MKTTDLQNKIINEEGLTLTARITSDEVVVYNELADQTVTKLHLIDQLNQQFSQFEEIIQRHHIVMKDISEIIIK